MARFHDRFLVMVSHPARQRGIADNIRYAFPPLLPDVIAGNIGADNTAVANSNIIALTATLLVRLVAGPSCDRFGPRKTFAGCLLIGAIPTFLSGTCYSVGQLYALRFFIGILGGSFVPCQVWTTAFFDKNIIGTANSLTAGFGNAGGGITYFVMPAVYFSLLNNRGLSQGVAWRVSFIVPGILIVTIAILLLVLCPDTPTGRWEDRFQAAENNLRVHGVQGAIVDVPGQVTEKPASHSDTGSDKPDIIDEEKKLDNTRGTYGNHEVNMSEQGMVDTARGEVVQKPSWGEVARVIGSPQTLAMAAAYFCSFGTELSVNSILGNYYLQKFPYLQVSGAGNWAAMFGLMNVVWRPLGGVFADVVYHYTGTVWGKKIILSSFGVIMGALLIALGAASGSYTLGGFICMIGIGIAFFLEAANGLVFSVVPHVHPYANGVVSGFTGACGNLGGIVFAIIFRYNTYIGANGKPVNNYAKSIWIIGIICMALHLATCWIPPVPKGQIGGR